MKKPLLVLFAIIALMVNAVSAQNVLQGIQHLNHVINPLTADTPPSGYTMSDNGNTLVLSYTEQFAEIWSKVEITATFDGTTDDAICINCVMVTSSNLSGFEDTTYDLTEDYEGATKGEVKMMWIMIYNLEDDDYDDDEHPEFFVTGWIEDAGLSMRLSFNGVSTDNQYWVEGTVIATFDSYDADALCVSCTLEGRSNLPGEEYVLEDLTEDYAGLSKPIIRMIFQMMLDEEIQSIQQVTPDNTTTHIYNLQGQPLMQLQQGINIVGSNKIIIK